MLVDCNETISLIEWDKFFDTVYFDEAATDDVPDIG